MIDKYFSAGNTSKGFVNYFDNSIDKDSASQILYIKGGSGVGKSTLMRKASDIAVKRGYDITHIHCSSDASSLDGIVIKDRAIAFFDATMPHISDPIYPRINGKIVDLGSFLDEAKLSPYKADVIGYVKEKKMHYRVLYSLLSTLNSTRLAISSLLDKDEKSLLKMRRDIIDDIKVSDTIYRRGFLRAIDKSGIVDFTADKAIGKKTYLISSAIYGVALDEVNKISKYFDNSLISHEKYYSLIEPDKVETIVLSESIITSISDVRPDILYNIDNLVNIKNKHAYDILSHYEKDIISLASTEIGLSQTAHAKLEEIYRNAMDFDALEKYSGALLSKLFL